ncbi:replication initiation factor domain-containing protein [Faecalicatena contorta]|uniref:replication initiation factor domain-containing protein n=1 Tax=Faecalicatena contorta TaxID=39482 RepID=UPI0023EDDD8B|nr:replication initiation factor domain-containing protein [Hungatella hathewayi]
MDYISIIFDSITAEEVISKILELPVDIFMKRPAKVKHKAYQSIYQAGSIKVYGDEKTEEKGSKKHGCYLVLSGRGCDEIYRIMNMRGSTFGNFFWLCEKRCGVDNFHLTRLDVAIDDRNEIPYFTPEQIKRKCEREEFVANSNSYRFVESSYTEKETAKTVYIGVGKSGMSYRFYDKDKEICMKHQKSYEAVGSWKRTEIQLRDEKAHAFAMLFKKHPLDLGQLAFDLLGSNLRFVKEDKNQSNKS